MSALRCPTVTPRAPVFRCVALAGACAAITVLAGACTPTSGTPASDSLPPLSQAPLSSAPLGADATTAPATPPGVLVVPASNHITGTWPTHCAAQGRLPDPACTPGSIRSDVDPHHLELTVCKAGWSESVLPPASEFARGKTEAMAAYGVPASQRRVTQLDHKIPRSLGGSNDVTNLWAEASDDPGNGAHNSKDVVETRVHLAVCHGTVPWASAVTAFAKDWTTAETTLGITAGQRREDH